MIMHATDVRMDVEADGLARRRALALLAASTGGALARPLEGLSVGELGSWELIGVPRRIEALERFRRAVDGETIRRLAEDYLDASSDPHDAGWLVARVLSEARPHEDAGTYMRRRIAEDYDDLRTHDFDGWLVSRTEARLLAVLALTS
ncbi:MAG: hypothetical protein R3195_14000 [Gemmatimonadota bacterium]|nr:hypothetical protein [Gemmatimonadota bacterium]